MTAEPLRIRPDERHGLRRSGARRRPGTIGRAYSRFVYLMKVLLPLAALGILVMLLAWPRLQEIRAPANPDDDGRLEMVGARYLGTDRDERPFSVVAERVARSTSEPSVVDLISPEAEMTRDDGSWVALRADRGRYDENTGKLLLLGNVDLFQDQGYEFRTEEAHVDTQAGNAWGDRPVTGQGPLGELFGEGFRLYDNGRTIVVTGRARMNLTGIGKGGEVR
jgi:lipopolysaccharide export system protein LptC